MKDNHVSISEAKARLGELVKRAAYGKERFILEFRDKPQAAIVGYEELRALEGADAGDKELAALDTLARIRAGLAAEGKSFDAAELVRSVREERLEQLTGVRGRQRSRKAHVARTSGHPRRKTVE